MSALRYMANHQHEVATLAAEHFWLVVTSIALAVAIGVPLGVLLTRQPGWKAVVLGTNNIIQTVPSLALFGLLLPLPWLGVRASRLAIVALTLYALLPIVRNTYTGIAGVNPAAREGAIALGLTSNQVLWYLEFPLAFPVMLAGVRVATVITVGVATIAAAIGAGGLGEFIFRGLAMVDNNVILAGAIPAAAMALAADLALGTLQRLVVKRRRAQAIVPPEVAGRRR
jgi:osmoprotectant transport system permease protein